MVLTRAGTEYGDDINPEMLRNEVKDLLFDTYKQYIDISPRSKSCNQTGKVLYDEYYKYSKLIIEDGNFTSEEEKPFDEMKSMVDLAFKYAQTDRGTISMYRGSCNHSRQSIPRVELTKQSTVVYDLSSSKQSTSNSESEQQQQSTSNDNQKQQQPNVLYVNNPQPSSSLYNSYQHPNVPYYHNGQYYYYNDQAYWWDYNQYQTNWSGVEPVAAKKLGKFNGDPLAYHTFGKRFNITSSTIHKSEEMLIKSWKSLICCRTKIATSPKVL
ncbi:hypothetical protein DERF_009139 [Dermatophagoides farinae]|uniref:Uncharacterized protein n=1 Tax=Dermatophagoides farinae TaxID=6954 RepID=A0A922HTD6_DERFA|nr:hypothetical protein DERF_009139 [Dermatophagoides farinae]